MNIASLETLLTRIRSWEPHIVGVELTPPMILHSKVLPPVEWDIREIEERLQVKLPQELKELWTRASELRLLEDTNYGQWGCILWSPADVVGKHLGAWPWERGEGMRPGDLIVGGFRGDADLVIVRCDPESPDFGHVVIALRNDAVKDWPTIAPSILDFATRFLDSPDYKYWERRQSE